MSRRLERVNELLREELGVLLARGLNDPRIPLLVTVTRVETSSDLRYSSVYVSIKGDKDEQGNALAGLQSATGFIQRMLRPSLRLKYVPFINFRLDHSFEDMTSLIMDMENISYNEGRDRE